MTDVVKSTFYNSVCVQTFRMVENVTEISRKDRCCVFNFFMSHARWRISFRSSGHCLIYNYVNNSWHNKVLCILLLQQVLTLTGHRQAKIHLCTRHKKDTWNVFFLNLDPSFTCLPCCITNIRWFKYDRDWFVCKQAALRSSCATLREWSHNLHPPSCSG